MDVLYNIIQPLRNRIAEIREELFEKQIYIAGEEKLIYGKFEKAYQVFKADGYRNGVIVTRKEFIENRIDELNKIALSVKPLEKKILMETGTEIMFHKILFQITNVIEYANSIKEVDIQQFEKPKRKINTNNKLTYKFLYDKGKLNDFFKLLKDHQLISKTNKYKDFEYIFSNKPVSDAKPIVWSSDVAAELIYFISEIINKGVIYGKGKNMDYKKMIFCFKTSDNNIFDANFRQIKNNIEFNLSQDKQSQINNIIKTIIK